MSSNLSSSENDEDLENFFSSLKKDKKQSKYCLSNDSLQDFLVDDSHEVTTLESSSDEGGNYVNEKIKTNTKSSKHLNRSFLSPIGTNYLQSNMYSTCDKPNKSVRCRSAEASVDKSDSSVNCSDTKSEFDSESDFDSSLLNLLKKSGKIKSKKFNCKLNLDNTKSPEICTKSSLVKNTTSPKINKSEAKSYKESEVSKNISTLVHDSNLSRFEKSNNISSLETDDITFSDNDDLDSSLMNMLEASGRISKKCSKRITNTSNLNTAINNSEYDLDSSLINMLQTNGKLKKSRTTVNNLNTNINTCSLPSLTNETESEYTLKENRLKNISNSILFSNSSLSKSDNYKNSIKKISNDSFIKTKPILNQPSSFLSIKESNSSFNALLDNSLALGEKNENNNSSNPINCLKTKGNSVVISPSKDYSKSSQQVYISSDDENMSTKNNVKIKIATKKSHVEVFNDAKEIKMSEKHNTSCSSSDPEWLKEAESDILNKTKLKVPVRLPKSKFKTPSIFKNPKYSTPLFGRPVYDQDSYDSVTSTDDEFSAQKESYETPKPSVDSITRKSKEVESEDEFISILDSLRTPKGNNRTPIAGSEKKKCKFKDCILRNVSDQKFSINKNNRDKFTKDMYKFLNESVFDNKLPSDMILEWSKKMTKTAGYCRQLSRTKTIKGIKCKEYDASISLSG